MLEVLDRAARRDLGNPVWYSLVQAGVVEVLCKTVTGQLNILDHVTKLQEAQVARGKARSEERAKVRIEFSVYSCCDAFLHLGTVGLRYVLWTPVHTQRLLYVTS